MCFSSNNNQKLKEKIVMSWSSRKKKEGIFCNVCFVWSELKRNLFVHFCCLCFKSLKALSVSLSYIASVNYIIYLVIIFQETPSHESLENAFSCTKFSAVFIEKIHCKVDWTNVSIVFACLVWLTDLWCI